MPRNGSKGCQDKWIRYSTCFNLVPNHFFSLAFIFDGFLFHVCFSTNSEDPGQDRRKSRASINFGIAKKNAKRSRWRMRMIGTLLSVKPHAERIDWSCHRAGSRLAESYSRRYVGHWSGYQKSKARIYNNSPILICWYQILYITRSSVIMISTCLSWDSIGTWGMICCSKAKATLRVVIASLGISLS